MFLCFKRFYYQVQIEPNNSVQQQQLKGTTVGKVGPTGEHFSVNYRGTRPFADPPKSVMIFLKNSNSALEVLFLPTPVPLQKDKLPLILPGEANS